MSDTGFSIGEALAAPFRLTARRPLTVFVWGLMAVVFAIVVMAILLPMLGNLPFSEGAADDAATFDALMAPMIEMQAVSGLLNIAQLALSLVLWSAVMRATLSEGRPERRFFLRVGMDEVWLLVVGVCLFVGLYAAVLILTLVGVFIGLALWGLGEPTNVVAIAILAILMSGVLIAGFARVSLIAPACLIYRRLAFPEGWRLAKGQTARLAALMIAVLLIYSAVYVAVVGGAVAVLASTGVFAGWQDASSLNDLMPSAGTLTLWIAVGIAPAAMLTGFLLTVISAPFASACLQRVKAGDTAGVDGLEAGR